MNPSPPESKAESHRLFSPEGVTLDLPIAGPVPRMAAYGVDFILVMLLLVGLTIALVVMLPIGKTVEEWFRSWAHEVAEATESKQAGQGELGRVAGPMIAVFLIAQFVCELGYFVFWEMVTNGRSPGKALLGLRVVRRDGLGVDLGSSLARNLLRIVDMLPANYVLGLIAMLVSSSGERLGDHAAGTIVVRLDRPSPAFQIDVSPAAAAATFTRQQLARIGPRELALIRATLRRLEALPADRRAALVSDIAETLRARLEITDLPSEDRERFLRDLLAASERYTRTSAY